MLKILKGFEHDTLAIRASNIVSANDYKDILMPELESKLKDHASIKIWYEFDKSFEGFTVGALWDDTKLGLFHFNDFYRVVILANDDLIRGMVSTLARIFPCPVNLFYLNESDLALTWLKKAQANKIE